MAVLSLPLTFTNSFWSQDYRRGLEVLYTKLEQGVAENAEIVAFVRARAAAEAQLGSSLTHPPEHNLHDVGFGADDGASLFMAFRGLQAESVKQGEAHQVIAKELQNLVAEPFEDWSRGHRDRIMQSRASVLEGSLRAYENAQGEVAKLKNTYLAKTRKADEAEDDARFAPNANGNGAAAADKYTTSPRLSALGPPSRNPRSPPNRTPSVSERIANRLKDIQRKTAANLQAAAGDGPAEVKAEEVFDAEDEKPLLPSKDNGKGKEVAAPEDAEKQARAVLERTASPPPLSPPLPPQKLSIQPPTSPMPPAPASPLIVAGVSLPPSAISALLTRAAAELPLRPVRFPLLGEYKDCFTGEEFVNWLNEHVDVFGGTYDKAEEAARELAEREGLLRRVGEFGNMFESADDAFYQFRPKAFELDKVRAKNGAGAEEVVSSPTTKQLADNLVKRSGTFVNLVQRAIQANTNGQGEMPYQKARRDAADADREYRIAVRKLDRQRLGLEERIEDTLKMLQRWEADRLGAVKTVLLQYQGTMANSTKSLEPSIGHSSTLIAAYNPESDLTALIERYRTGPFRPNPQVYESVAHDESDVVFGIDLRKWAEGGWTAIMSGENDGPGKKELVPPVLTALLEGLKEVYPKAPNDIEKRKTWIYEVPLAAVHHLRESLHAADQHAPIPVDILTKYDPPVLASAVKLWLLELDPPLALYEGYDDLRKIYPQVGAKKADGEVSEEKHLEDLQNALQRLPRVHLQVLDAIIAHLKNLIAETNVDEPTEVYISKLALTLGRTVCRPRFETSLSVQDRHPTLLFIDLLNHYEKLIPPTIAKKKRESERKVPIRKRTAPVDMRMHRSRLSVGDNIRGQIAAVETGKALPPVAAPTPQHPPTVPEVSEPAPEPERKPTVPAPAPAGAPADPAIPAEPAAPAPAPEIPAAEPAPALSAMDPDAPPARPTFKEPPPEADDLPPRPQFKEPPPEVDEDDKSPSAAVVDTAPSSQSPSSPRSRAAAAASPKSRSPSPRNSVNVTRKISSSDGARVSGPRGTRGPRSPNSGSVSGIIANLNRNSVSGAPPASPGASKRLSGSQSPGADGQAKRLSRTSALSRRTVASDAEDEVLGKT